MSTFSQSVSTCLSKYVTFSGRARRSEYWWFVLFVVVGSVLFTVVDGILFGTNPETGEVNQILSGLFSLAMFLPGLAAGWRRLHDTGRPGWYLLFPMIISAAMALGLFLGIAAFSVAEQASGDPDALRAPAAVRGLAGMAVAGLLQLAVFILLIWWMTRPTQEAENQYGPIPSP